MGPPFRGVTNKCYLCLYRVGVHLYLIKIMIYVREGL